MHINAATLLNLVHLSMVVASIPAGLSVTLGGAPSAAPLVVHGRKLSQVSAVVWCAALRGGSMYDITSDFRRLSAFYLACAVLPTALRVALSVVMSTPLSTSLPQPWQVGVALCWVAGNVADLYVVAHEIRQHDTCFANLLPHPTSSRLGKVTRACIFLSGWLMMLYLTNTSRAATLGAAAAPGWCAAMLAKVAWCAALRRWPVASLRSRQTSVGAMDGGMDDDLQAQKQVGKISSSYMQRSASYEILPSKSISSYATLCQLCTPPLSAVCTPPLPAVHYSWQSVAYEWQSIEYEDIDLLFARARKPAAALEAAAKVEAVVSELWLPPALLAASTIGFGVSHHAIHSVGYDVWGNALVRWPVTVHFGWTCVAVLAILNERLGQTPTSLRTREKSAMASVGVAMGAVAYVTATTRDAVFAAVVMLALAAIPNSTIDQRRRYERRSRILRNVYY
jgi:hypothetical protein